MEVDFFLWQFVQDVKERQHRIEQKLDKVLVQLTEVIQREKQMAQTLDDVLADVQSETTVVQSAITLLDNLTAMLKAAGTDPAKIAAVIAAVDGNKKALADAIVANTPAPPPTT